MAHRGLFFVAFASSCPRPAECTPLHGNKLRVYGLPFSWLPMMSFDADGKAVDGVIPHFLRAAVQHANLDVEVEFVQGMEMATDLDVVGWCSKHLMSGYLDVCFTPQHDALARPEMEGLVYLPPASMVTVRLINQKVVKEPNLLEFVSPFSGWLWLVILGSVVMGALVMAVLTSAEGRHASEGSQQCAGLRLIAWSVYEAVAALLGSGGFETASIQAAMASVPMEGFQPST